MGTRKKRWDFENETSRPESPPLTTKERILLREFSADELLDELGLAGETLKQFDDEGTLANRLEAFSGNSELLDLMTLEGPTKLIAKISAEAASRMIELNQSTDRDNKETLIRDSGEVVVITLAIDRCLEADPVDVGQALDLAVKLGMAYQRMVVRDAEPHVKRGVKIKKGARSGHTKVHGTDEQKRERRQKMAEMVQKLRDEGESKMKAYSAVAEQCKCSSRTVQTAVKKTRGGG